MLPFLLVLAASGHLSAQVATQPYTKRPEVTNAVAVKQAQAAAYRLLKEPRPEGRVVLRGVVDQAGILVKISFVSQADSVLNEIAQTTFMRMRFTPALNGTDPVLVWIEIPFVFGPELLREPRRSDTGQRKTIPETNGPDAGEHFEHVWRGLASKRQIAQYESQSVPSR